MELIFEISQLPIRRCVIEFKKPQRRAQLFNWDETIMAEINIQNFFQMYLRSGYLS